MRRPTAPGDLAAVDLGSNSFHLVVARVRGGQLQVVDRLRERVALAEALGPDLRLSAEGRRRALACLERFGQRLADMPAGSVRAVGTSTLRRCRDASRFLQRAARALGHSVEVVSGPEEARLIHLGVASGCADDGTRRLVVDIGGGSTECIIGERLDPLRTASLDLGCITWTRRFLARGTGGGAFEAAVTAARVELEPIERSFRALGWDEALGASGTIGAVDAVLRGSGPGEGGITLDRLRGLARHLIRAGHPRRYDLPGLSPERAPVLAGGVAVLLAVFEAFRLKRMTATSNAMREGVLVDLLGRLRHQDVRGHAIRRLAERHHVDREQAARVERTALALFDQACGPWRLDRDRDRTVLAWAARLHEVGLALSFGGHHRHGAYVIANSDMPGFSQQEQALLATLVLGHRRRVPVDELGEQQDGVTALRLCILLRLAAHLNRARSDRSHPRPRLEARGRRLAVAFPRGWLRRHPLTHADLDAEAQALAAAGVRLVVS